MSGLAVAGLTVALGGRDALAGADLEAPKGVVTGLIGPNGAGKSTLLAAVAGILPLKAGAIRFDGRDLSSLRRDARARLCAWVAQTSATDERLTVRDVVMLGRLPHGSGPGARDQGAVDSALAQSGVAEFAARDFNSLSGGEKQRVQIARALAQEPRLMLLDEPTSHLDIAAQLQVFALLRSIAGGSCCVVVALHDLNQAMRFCDRVVVLSRGATVAQGRPVDVLSPGVLWDVYGVGMRLVADGHGDVPLIVYDRAE